MGKNYFSGIIRGGRLRIFNKELKNGFGMQRMSSENERKSVPIAYRNPYLYFTKLP